MALSKAIGGWKRWGEPWFLAYALLAATIGGVPSILLPLAVTDAGQAAHVGVVMATLYAGGLTSAWWGSLADRHGWHKAIFTIGALAAALAYAALALASEPAALIGLALTIGTGTAAVNTLANLLVVEKYPRVEWDDRVSWLQACYNTGMLGGMLLAGAVAEGPLRVGLMAAGALAAGATLLAWATVPALPPAPHRGAGRHSPTGPGHRRVHVPRWHLPHFDWDHRSPYAVLGGSTGAALRRLKASARGPFTLLQLAWLMTNTSAGILYALYPLVMVQVFGISPGPAAAGLALATGLSTALYAPSSQWIHRFGPERVMQGAVATRAVALLALVGLAGFPTGQPDWLALLAFAGVVLAWPPLSVSSTMVASLLSASAEGEGLGIYTAVRALGSLLGAAFSGWTAHHLGYDTTLDLALLVAILAVLLSLPLGAPGARNAAPLSAADGSS